MSTAVVSPLFSDGYFDNDILSVSPPGCNNHLNRRSLEIMKSLESTLKTPLSERLSLGFLSRFSSLSSSTSSTTGNEHRKLDRSLSEPVDRQQQQKSNQTNSSRYKTELCRPYEENGTCKYGDKCQFAHGHHEVRNLARHPKYKTELCRTFHSSGFCPYGPRCHFIHNPDESRKSANSSCTSSCSNSQSSTPPPPQHQTLRQSIRPKALSVSNFASLSSTGDTSPSSSLSGSPTSFSTFFDDSVDSSVFSPKTPIAQNAFSFSNDFSGLLLAGSKKFDVESGLAKKSNSELDDIFRRHDLTSPIAIKQAITVAELKRLSLNEAASCRSQMDFGRDEGGSSYPVLTPQRACGNE